MKSMKIDLRNTHTHHSNLRQVTSSSSLRRFSKFCFQRISSPRISWAEHSGKCVAAKCSCIVLFTSASPQKKGQHVNICWSFRYNLKGKKIDTFLGPARVKEFNGVDLVSEKKIYSRSHCESLRRVDRNTLLLSYKYPLCRGFTTHQKKSYSM